MAVGVSSTHGRLQTEINIIPMIDILLVLIVIFMILQSGRMVTDMKVPSDTPSAATASPQILLQLRDDHTYAINGTVVAAEFLGRRLRELYDARPVKLLFVQAGPDWTYQDVIEVIGTAKGAGVQTVGFMPYEPRSP